MRTRRDTRADLQPTAIGETGIAAVSAPPRSGSRPLSPAHSYEDILDAVDAVRRVDEGFAA